LAYTGKLFLALFVLLFIASIWLRNRPAVKEWLIIAFSLLVILSWGALSLLTFLVIALLNYGAAQWIARTRSGAILAAAIAVDLAALAAFKYHGFFGGNGESGFGSELPVFSLGIPLAISFYTFHLISYLVDLRAGEARLASPKHYLFYLGFFPHVVAGPIVRPWQFLPQIGKVRDSAGDWTVGFHHLAVGLFLKAVVANKIGRIIDPVWDGSSAFVPTSADRLVVAFLYYCQIYSDFAGYTLMALGMARLLGYRLPPNFRQPMFAVSLHDFWRRWHITLSRWLRDYLYRPLGGNRGGPSRTVANLMITMLLGAMWHGAGWGFLVWGFLHGLGLVAERLLGLRRPVGLMMPVWWLVTQLWVTLAWIFFRNPALENASSYLAGLVPDGAGSLSVHRELWIGFLFAAAAILQQAIQVATIRYRRHAAAILASTTVFALMCSLLVFSPAKVFIYFKF
jgi:D-alanyl-lipoteichoic acid acyltransferase DltB (MBOAT superfamily)